MSKIKFIDRLKAKKIAEKKAMLEQDIVHASYFKLVALPAGAALPTLVEALNKVGFLTGPAYSVSLVVMLLLGAVVALGLLGFAAYLESTAKAALAKLRQ